MADDDTAVSDPGPVPAFPELSVHASMLKKDVTDAGRVIREGVGDLQRREEETIETCRTIAPCSLGPALGLGLGRVSGGTSRRGLTSCHLASLHCSMVTGGGSKEARTM